MGPTVLNFSPVNNSLVKWISSGGEFRTLLQPFVSVPPAQLLGMFQCDIEYFEHVFGFIDICDPVIRIPV